MKSFYLLALGLLFAISGLAQTSVKDQKTKNVCNIADPLPDEAFNKMIVQDITYAIVGESTPVSGLKVDISKPEATISGVFAPKRSKIPWDLFSFEFKGGVTDRNFSIFKGFNSFNTGFEFRPSFHFIPALNSANYGTCDEARPKLMVTHAKNKLVQQYATAITDTLKAVTLIRNHHLAVFNELTSTTIDLPTEANITDSQKKVVVHFIKKFTKNEEAKIDDSIQLPELLKLLPQASRKEGEIDIDNNIINYKDEVIEAQMKYEKLYKVLGTDTVDKMIKNVSAIWTRKKYWWGTLSPFGRTEKVNEFFTKYKDKDSSYFKSDYQFYYGLTGYVNRYIVVPDKRAHFIRLGITLAHSNNLTALTSYNYETRSPFFSYGNMVTEKTKSGTAYNHEDIKKGFTKQFTFEYYRLSLKSLVPGVYFSSNVNQSSLYRLPNFIGREEDKTQVGLEGGSVFNINSREKDKEKSLFSILFYVRHEDLTDKRRTSRQTGLEESREDFRKRNLSLGIRVGIPITLPQRSS
jgi:hypothetical protein